MSRLRLVAALALLFVPAFAQGHRELGRMWTLENAPLEAFEQEYGFRPDAAWLEQARLSALRYGRGCSASFVSPRGLIMTNHHCARDHIASVTPAGEDWLTDGYFAQSLSTEVKVPGLTVQQLLSTEDVTAAMNAGLDGLTSDNERTAQLAKNREEVLNQARAKNPGSECQLVTLYQGGSYQIYVYKIWDDIRLVAAPQLQMGKFGGDPDNFTYPRFSLDFTFVRAYENDAPADTSKHHFRWRTEGPKDGELTFVLGNPGSTGRLNTLAQMEYLRDAMFPLRINDVKRRIADLERQAAADPEKAKELRPQILSLENARKAFTGYLDGLRNEEVLAIKRRAEADLRAAIARDPELEARFGTAFDDLAEIAAERTTILKQRSFYPAFDSPVFAAARDLAMATDPAASEDDKKLAAERFAAAELAAEPEQIERVERIFSRGLEFFGDSDPVLNSLLAGQEPKAAAARLHQSGDLFDAEARKKLLAGGREAVLSSKDPVVRASPLLRADARALAAREQALAAAEELAAKRVGEAYFTVYKTSIPPDATFTLRISDGLVKGFPMNGTIAPFFTSLYGLYARNTEFGDQDPFHLPQNWKDKRSELNMETPFCLVSTNDIIGGNSGSAMIDRELRVVGLIFDGNIESLANRFVFTDKVARSVSVHPAIIIESLRRVYGASALADELEAKGPGYR